MLSHHFKSKLDEQPKELTLNGLYKSEQTLLGAQPSQLSTHRHGHLINLCANNYLGLAEDPDVIAEAHADQKKCAIISSSDDSTWI